MGNVRPEFSQGQLYDLKMTIEGKQLTYEEHHVEKRWIGNPVTDEIEINYRWPSQSAHGDGEDCINSPVDYEYTSTKFHSKYIQRMDGYKGEFMFYNADKKAELVLTKYVPPLLNISQLVGPKTCP